MLRAAAKSLLSLVYPHQCRVCRNLAGDLLSSTACEDCWSEVRLFSQGGMVCEKCGSLIGERRSPSPSSCGRCNEFEFDKAVSLGVYEGALASAVVELKRTPFLDRRVRKLISDSPECREISSRADLIIPVPLSTIRRHQRGFNQAEVIASEIASVTGIPVDGLSLARKRHTPMHRIGMDSKARRLASLKAFAVSRKESIAGRRILLVDDVMTSGATASACASALKKCGSGGVDVFTLARAVMH